MKNSIALLSLALFLLNSLSSQTTSNVSVSPRAIDALFREYDQPTVPGAAVATIHDGKIIQSRSYGLASLEEKQPVTGATNFRLASVTKQFTAVAILILAERKKLSLDDPLAKFFPRLPSRVHGIKIRHLLNHTSGIVDYESLMPDTQSVQVLDRDVLALLEQADSTYLPAGSKFRYSNSGYALLALVVEAVSGQSFAQFLQRNFFVPLNMNDTVARETNTVVANRAYGYTRSGSGFVFADQSSTSAVLGDGGIYSSVDDLFIWDQALYSDKLVSWTTLQLAMSPTTVTDTAAFRYGYGWYVADYGALKTVFHTGSSRGFRNAIIRIHEKRFTVIILTNRNKGRPIEMARQIVGLYFTQH
ncbi:MAG: serine hydrolase domain-containing protein [Bacteroidota bacterium]